MILSPVIRQRYFNANGTPLAGGKLYSYIAGTTTPQATYTDQGGSTPNANPVVMDANGEANVWVDPSLVYKFILQDSNSVVQWTVDNVYPPGGTGAFTGDTGTGGGGGLVPAPAAGDAAAKKYLGAGGSFIRLPTPTLQSLIATGTTTGYLFTISAGNATVGAVYRDSVNSRDFTVLATITAGTELFTSQPLAPGASGTLTKQSGTGDASFTFSAALAIATYTTAANALYLRVRMVAGGGGGGGSGTAAGGTGGTGGISYFGAGVLRATGGVGGQSGGISNIAGPSSSIGSATGRIFRGTAGGAGRVDATGTSGNTNRGGTGGNSAFWSGGAGTNSTTNGSDGSLNTGGGGSGANFTSAGAATTSGAGGGSGTAIEAFIYSPSSTYPYVVGAAGTAGTLGAGGSAGGNGGAGYIEVTEYY